MTLTNQQKLVMERLNRGGTLVWIPSLKLARFLNRQGHVYAKTFEALRAKGVLVLHQQVPGRDGLPDREMWRAA